MAGNAVVDRQFQGSCLLLLQLARTDPSVNFEGREGQVELQPRQTGEAPAPAEADGGKSSLPLTVALAPRLLMLMFIEKIKCRLRTFTAVFFWPCFSLLLGFLGFLHG